LESFWGEWFVLGQASKGLEIATQKTSVTCRIWHATLVKKPQTPHCANQSFAVLVNAG
jgi:hypothetical protein